MVLTAFSTKTSGPTGLAALQNSTYAFLKSSPSSGANTKDPVSREVFQSFESLFKKRQEELYKRVDQTKHQIRANNFSASGASVQRHSGFEFRQDYHRTARRDEAYDWVKYALLSALLYYLLVK